MSGGHFNYDQYFIKNIASKIEEVLEDTSYYDLSKEDVLMFEAAIYALNAAYIYTQRIDWYLSGDDGEEEFHKRLKEELEVLSQEK